MTQHGRWAKRHETVPRHEIGVAKTHAFDAYENLVVPWIVEFEVRHCKIAAGFANDRRLHFHVPVLPLAVILQMLILIL